MDVGNGVESEYATSSVNSTENSLTVDEVTARIAYEKLH